MEQNSQGRRPHYHRGRRGTDRRGPDRRAAQAQEQTAPRSGDQVDVEQIMRDIRARISQRHGIELSAQQIHELAARRLEAILDPRSINPTLMQQLRRGADAAPDIPAAPADAGYTFEENTLYETHRGVLRFFRRLLNPILKLFFNPNPLVHALHTQAALNREAAAREAERQRLQAEWNALHYEILQRLVTEVSRVSVEMQSLTLRVESLTARVDFNDRKVRSLDTPPSGRQQPRPVDQPPAPQQTAPASGDAPATETPAAADGTPGAEGTRKRRRRRRGRRGSGTGAEGGAAATIVAGEGLAGPDTVGLSDADEGDDDDPEGDAAGASDMLAVEDAPASFAVETVVAAEAAVMVEEEGELAPPPAPEPAVAAAPPEQPAPPPDEPAPQAPAPPDPGPPDR